ncbi:uncharacterized protein LOC123675828 [Harmonia axyridis]|uniref:uncharacterized protein LOC123675828 n=1 Tax=Harmonia axyridis TaxID=115357 RepID=UPI001E277BCE|nr:uncharacterized protein LOC123675828 [Harmonia axyridis]
MSLKKPQESGSYMDDVKVKIAEEYKPPPKINIPMTHNQRLIFNKHIQNNLPNYDFSMERNILKKIKEWKSDRLTNEEQRLRRLQCLKEKEESDEKECKEDEEETVEMNVPTSHEIEVSSIGPSCTTSYSNGMLMPTKAVNYYSNVLQPIPLSFDSNQQKSYASSSGIKSPFNFSEFEADTSSPFDNVALKSINDVEELAKVLKIEDDTPKSSTPSYSNYHINNIQNYPNYSSISSYPSSVSCITQNSMTGLNGYYNTCDMNAMRSFTSNYQCSPPSVNYATTYNSNHITPREKTNGENSRLSMNNTSSKIKPSPESIAKKSDSIPTKNVSNLIDPFNELPKHLQEFSRNISSMGFPLPRVARTCKVLGNDNKKVVDHLLAMSELLDLGFAEDQISEALLQSDNDRDKALDKLVS